MRSKKISVLFGAILFLLGALATWDEWQSKKDELLQKSKNRIVVDRLLADVSEIDYLASTRSDSSEGEYAEKKTHVKLISAEGHWNIVSPISASADGQVVEGLINSIFDYRYVKVVSDKREEWANFGLVDPLITVTVRFKNGLSPLVINIGNKTPVGYNLYLRTNSSDSVLLGSQHLLIALTKSIFEFRDKRIATVDLPTLKTIRYKLKGDEEILINRQGDEFKISFPKFLDADKGSLDELVQVINEMRAISFRDGNDTSLAELFLDPYLMIDWEDARGPSRKLSFVQTSGKLFAAFEPERVVYEIDQDKKSKLTKELIDFRNRRNLRFALNDVSEVEINGQLFRSVNNEWSLIDKSQKVALKAAPQIRALLVDMEFGRTKEFFNPADVAKDISTKPENTIIIRFNDSAIAPLVIDLFRTSNSDQDYLVRKSGDVLLYQIPRQVFANINSSALPENNENGVGHPGSHNPLGKGDEVSPGQDEFSDG